MKLASLLNTKLIKLGGDFTTKKEAILYLVDRIYESYNFEMKKEEIAKNIFERESLGGTNFETGISIPHCRVDEFGDLIISVVIPKKPIMDEGTEIKMLIVLITDKSSSSFYLNTLAEFIKISQSELFGKLLKSKNVSEFVSLIKEANIQVEKEVTVERIMDAEFPRVGPETTLKELLNVLRKHTITFLPVVDDSGKYLGELHLPDILKLGIPHYAFMVGNLKFLSEFEPFEELFKNENKIKAKDIMEKPKSLLTPESSICEAALELLVKHHRHASVVSKGKFMGVISMLDILNKVLRG